MTTPTTTESDAGRRREVAPATALPAGLAAAAVFLASGAVLVLEVAGLRLVGPYLGITLQTSSAVIGISLGAIAYGAWTGGFLADRTSPRRLLAPAFLLAGASTAVTLPLVRWSGEWLRGSATGGTLLLVGLTVFVPAALLSAITPLVVKLQLGDVRQTGRVVGRLSGIGTLGGITATLGTGFVLVAALPTSAILLTLAGLLTATGLGLYVYLRRSQHRRHGQSLTPMDRRAAAVAAIGLAGGGVLNLVAPNPCDVETAYHCAAVIIDDDRPGGRLLMLNSARHSYVDLSDPRYLQFAYTRWFGTVIDTFRPADQAVRTVHLGGGGFTMPRYLAATRPGSFSRVLELDGDLVALDEQRLGVQPSPQLDIVIGDARISLASQPDADADLVVGDAFGHLAVPWHLTTEEFLRDVRRVLRPDGVYLLNVIDYPPTRLLKAELATVQRVFPHIALIGPGAALAGRIGSNFVIVAAAVPLPLDAIRAGLAKISVTETAMAPRLVTELAEWTDGATVLTDDFAPVDQLLNHG